MIDVGGAALLGAAARNAAGVAAVADPAHYPRVVNEIREMGQVSPETRAQLAAEAFSTVAAYHAEIAAYLNQISGNTFPRRLAHRPREGGRPALRREPAPARGVLPRDDPPQRHARRRDPDRRATCPVVQQPAWTSTPRTGSPATTRRPTVAIVKHTDPVGLASHDELVEAYRHALETDPVASFGGIVGVNRELDGATAREIAANSYEAVVAPGLQPVRARDPARPSPASRSWPSRPTRPRGCATTASPTSTSSASPAACSSRAWTSWASTAAGSRSSPSAGRRSRS